MEDEQGVVDWGEHNATTIETFTPAKAKEMEELRAENERLRNEASSPEVAKQKRLCFHLADDLRRFYGEFQDAEQALIAHLQAQEEANGDGSATASDLEPGNYTCSVNIDP